MSTFEQFANAIKSNTSGSAFSVNNVGAGIALEVLGQGLVIGAPTGGNKGSGTSNAASGFYVNNVAVPTISSSDTLSNKTIASPVLSGTATASGTFTMPAFALGGTVTATGQTITGGTYTSPSLTTPTIGVATATSINFGGTALSVYAEGTWTPTIQGTSTAGTGTYDFQVGRYTRIGRMVIAECTLAWSAHTGTGNMQVAGLPFAPGSSSGITYADTVNMTITGMCQIATSNGSTICSMAAIVNGSGSAIAMDTAVAQFRFTITYFV